MVPRMEEGPVIWVVRMKLSRARKKREANIKAAVVPIRSEQCSGCHMKVSQNLINEVRRGLKLMTCESCSRIVYLEEAETAASK